MKHDQPFKIEQDIKQSLEDVVTTLEERTGKKYQLILQEHQTIPNNDLVINAFKDRSQFIIYDMSPDCSDLNSVYNSYQEIENRLKLLYIYFAKDYKDDPEHPGSYLWQCPLCSTYGGGEKGRCLNRSGNGICQRKGCDFSCDSKYANISVDLHSGVVFKSSGGTLRMYETIGKIKIMEGGEHNCSKCAKVFYTNDMFDCDYCKKLWCEPCFPFRGSRSDLVFDLMCDYDKVSLEKLDKIVGDDSETRCFCTECYLRIRDNF